MPTRRYWIEGRVQGVWFRAKTRERATDLGLHGWVRNLPDGRVEVLAEGSEDALEGLWEFLNEGPPLARVDAVSTRAEAAEADLSGFEIRF